MHALILQTHIWASLCIWDQPDHLSEQCPNDVVAAMVQEIYARGKDGCEQYPLLAQLQGWARLRQAFQCWTVFFESCKVTRQRDGRVGAIDRMWSYRKNTFWTRFFESVKDARAGLSFPLCTQVVAFLATQVLGSVCFCYPCTVDTEECTQGLSSHRRAHVSQQARDYQPTPLLGV